MYYNVSVASEHWCLKKIQLVRLDIHDYADAVVPALSSISISLHHQAFSYVPILHLCLLTFFITSILVSLQRIHSNSILSKAERERSILIFFQYCRKKAVVRIVGF